MLLRVTVTSCLLLSVAACGGGGGGGGDDDLAEFPFTSFSNAPADGIIIFEGQSVTSTYTADLSTGNVTVAAAGPTQAGTQRLTRQGGNTTGLSISSPAASVNFDTGRGDTINDTGGVVVYRTQNGQQVALISDERDGGFEHQTFGVWSTGNGTAQGTFSAGSFGARTEAANVPTGTIANYSGSGIGLARLTDGQPYGTNSTVTVRADFNTNQADIASSGTFATNLNDTNLGGPAPELDFSGSGPVTGSGFVAAISGTGTSPVSGNAQGQFYGPQANEVGGTFSTTSANGVVHNGAFGGR